MKTHHPPTFEQKLNRLSEFLPEHGVDTMALDAWGMFRIGVSVHSFAVWSADKIEAGINTPFEEDPEFWECWRVGCIALEEAA